MLSALDDVDSRSTELGESLMTAIPEAVLLAAMSDPQVDPRKQALYPKDNRGRSFSSYSYSYREGPFSQSFHC